MILNICFRLPTLSWLILLFYEYKPKQQRKSKQFMVNTKHLISTNYIACKLSFIGPNKMEREYKLHVKTYILDFNRGIGVLYASW